MKKSKIGARSGTSEMDMQFFQESAVKARTVGKFIRKDFVRGSGVANVPTDLNAAESPVLPSKKSHKSGKKAVKNRTQWTAVAL
jgi:hypothetical protein